MLCPAVLLGGKAGNSLRFTRSYCDGNSRLRLCCISLLTLLVVVRPRVLGDLGVVDSGDNRRWSFKRDRR